MATKNARPSAPSWSEVKTKLTDSDRAGLLGLVQDLYAASKENKTFLHDQPPDFYNPIYQQAS